MENKNQPAFPQSNVHITEGMESGLTKREYTSIQLLATTVEGSITPEQAVREAIKLTDELLKQLENDNKNK